MTDEQKTAFVNAQVALLNAEVAGYQAENKFREGRGLTIAYGGDEFEELIDRYRSILAPMIPLSPRGE